MYKSQIRSIFAIYLKQCNNWSQKKINIIVDCKSNSFFVLFDNVTLIECNNYFKQIKIIVFSIDSLIKKKFSTTIIIFFFFTLIKYIILFYV